MAQALILPGGWNWWDWAAVWGAVLITCYMAWAKNPHPAATPGHHALRLAKTGICLALCGVGLGLVSDALALAALALAIILTVKGRTLCGVALMVFALSASSTVWLNLGYRFTERETAATRQAVLASSPILEKIVLFDPFLVDLPGADHARCLKLGVSVLADNEAVRKKLKAKTSGIRNAVFLLLTKKTYAQIASVEGKEKLRTEMLNIINAAIAGQGRAEQLLFTEFVVY